MVKTVKTAHTVATDYGVFPVPRSVAIVMDAAKKRNDGSFDKRTAAYRFLRRYQNIADAIAMSAYMRCQVPVFPEASALSD